MTEWIVVTNWDRFQHYTDRNPVWIKLYTELSNRDEWRDLSLAARGLLVSIWIAYAQSAGQLRVNTLSAVVAQKARRDSFDSLVEAGFIKLRASKPLAIGYHSRARAKRREEKTPKPPKSKVTGWRQVRGSHGITHIPDPFGTDVPPIGRPL